MQVIFLPPEITIILCFFLWGVIQYTVAYYCMKLPVHKLLPARGLLRTYPFEEEGRIYEKVFRISRWKHLLPDGNIITQKEKFNKKHLVDLSEENLTRFLIESARAEWTHWLAIPPFVLFGLFVPTGVVGYMLLYALVVNLPCIMAQRYNRPRVRKLLQRMRSHEASAWTAHDSTHN